MEGSTMAMRDEVEALLVANCGPEEIVSAMAVAGYHPDSLRKCLRQCGVVASVPEDRSTKRKRDRLNEGGHRKCEELSDDTLKRIDLFEFAQGRTKEQIRREWPNVDSKWIDRVLAEHCSPFSLKYGEKLKAVLMVDADGVYRKCRSEKFEMPARSSIGRAGRMLDTGKRRGGKSMAMASEAS